MADMINLVIQVTEEEQEQIKALALARGFDDVHAYLKSLIELDADEPTLEEIHAGIKQGLREALRGDFVSLDQLWSDDDK